MTTSTQIVTICGSMRFFPQMLQVAADETAKGNIVLAPFSVVAPEDQDSELKEMLDRLHRQKIDMAGRVIVVTNQHGYVGASTLGEMTYTAQQGKTWDVREFRLPEPTPTVHSNWSPSILSPLGTCEACDQTAEVCTGVSGCCEACAEHGRVATHRWGSAETAVAAELGPDASR